MKQYFTILITLTFNFTSFGQNLKESDSTSFYSNSGIENVVEKYVLGDLNNDNQVDTATAYFDRVVLKDSSWTLDCGKPNCYINIKFSSNITELNIEATDIYIDTVTDVNKDGSNEILIFWWRNLNMWINLKVYTYKDLKWTSISEATAFVGDDNDFKNRIIKKGKKFYLIGDKWNKDYTLIQKYRVEINSK